MFRMKKDSDVRRQDAFKRGFGLGALGGGIGAAVLLDAAWIVPVAVLSGAILAVWSWIIIKG